MSIESFITQCENSKPIVHQKLVEFGVDSVIATKISSNIRAIIENSVKAPHTRNPDQIFYNPPKKSLTSWSPLKVHFFEGNGSIRMYIHLPSSIPNKPRKSIRGTVLIHGNDQNLGIIPIIRLTMTPFSDEDSSQMRFEARTAVELSAQQKELHKHFFPITTDSIAYKGRKREKIMMYQESCHGDFHNLLSDNHPLHSRVMGKMNVLVPVFHNFSRALKLVHEKKIIHNDLKLENLLYKLIFSPLNHQYLEGLLTDFGSGCPFDHKTRNAFITGGTPLTFAPERIELFRIKDADFRPEMIDEKSDIWSLGVIFHVLYFGEYPQYSLIGDRIQDVMMELSKLHPNQRATHRNTTNHRISQIMAKNQQLKNLLDSATQEKESWGKINPKVELNAFDELLRTGKTQDYFEEIIYQMLQPNPKDRLSLQQVCDLLDTLLTKFSKPVSTHPQSPMEKSLENASSSEMRVSSPIADSSL